MTEHAHRPPVDEGTLADLDAAAAALSQAVSDPDGNVEWSRAEYDRARCDEVERQLRGLGVELTERVTITAGAAIVEGTLEGIAVVDTELVLVVNEGEADRVRLTVLLWQNVGAIRVEREE